MITFKVEVENEAFCPLYQFSLKNNENDLTLLRGTFYDNSCKYIYPWIRKGWKTDTRTSALAA